MTEVERSKNCLDLFGVLPLQECRGLILEVERIPVRLRFDAKDVRGLSTWQILVKWMRHFKVSITDQAVESILLFNNGSRYPLLRVVLRKSIVFFR